MAVYTFTGSAVLQSGAPQVGTCGEAIAPGDFLYQHTDTKLYKAESGDTAAKARVIGMAVNSAAAGQPVCYVVSGEITVDAAKFAGAALPLILSPTAGKCEDVGDLAAEDWLTFVGWSTATNKFMLRITATNLQKPT